MARSQEQKEARLKLFVAKYLETGRLDLSAEAAGYTGKPVSLSVSGSRLLKRAKEQGLIEKAREKVLAKVERATVATQVEALEELTAQLRRIEPTKTIIRPNGTETVFEPRHAAALILEHYKPKEGSGAVNLNLLLANVNGHSGKDVKAAYFQTFQALGGGNGNGHS